jgi:hypothetical protein
MDYILFHSQYSPSSRKLIEQFPPISEKAVLVDSVAMRAYAKRLHIICVPTLIVILNNKIVERIVGYENIYNWVVVTLYRVNKLQSLNDPEPEEERISEQQPTRVYAEEQPVSPDVVNTTTSLDKLVLEDVEEERVTPHVPIGSGGVSTLQLAEAMKKERDNSDPGNKKKFSN